MNADIKNPVRPGAQRADPIDNRTSGRTTVRSADGRRAYARPTNIVTTRKRLIFPIERTLARVLLLQEQPACEMPAPCKEFGMRFCPLIQAARIIPCTSLRS